MNGKPLSQNIDWKEVKLFELEKGQVRVVLRDGERVDLMYQTADDLRVILQNISRPGELADSH